VPEPLPLSFLKHRFDFGYFFDELIDLVHIANYFYRS